VRDVDSHVAAATSLVTRLPTERVPLASAVGRVLAADVVTTGDLPAFDNSSMDGFALRASDGVAERAVIGESAAGRPFDGTVVHGQAVRIMTGAPVPAGADAVVPLEDAHEAAGVVTVAAAPAHGAFIRRAGSDAQAGAVVVEAGVVLTPARVGAAAAAGAGAVEVSRRPVVAVLSTGDELAVLGGALGPGQIHDANAPLLAAALEAVGAIPMVLPHVGDDPTAMLDALTGVEADLIVTTGGASVGAHDVAKAALASRGVEFVNVAMQPGKPQGLGVFGGTPTVCLPGNPVSVAVSFAVIVRPMLRVLTGQAEPLERRAIAARGWGAPPQRRQYQPIRWLNDGLVAPSAAGGSQSHLIASLAAADAFAVVDADVDEVREGDTVALMELLG
jgi:molybdopterin molybdotransferase